MQTGYDSTVMEQLISNLLKKQNQILLQKISEKYKLEEKKIMTMYHTPTFYQIDKVPSEYQVQQVCIRKKK